jgi:hypothetical protein
MRASREGQVVGHGRTQHGGHGRPYFRSFAQCSSRFLISAS